MRFRHKIAVVVGGVALVGGMTACGNASDEAERPTVADVQQQALAADQKARQAHQDPALRYPPLAIPGAKPFMEFPPGVEGTVGPVPNNQVQIDQDPVLTALQRIQEISAQSADISNRPDEARNYFNSVDGLYDAVKDELDGEARDGLEKGFSEMRAALDHSARVINSGSQPEIADALAAAEAASGDIQVVIYHFAQRRFEAGDPDITDDRDTFCSPLSGCGPHGYDEYKGHGY